MAQEFDMAEEFDPDLADLYASTNTNAPRYAKQRQTGGLRYDTGKLRLDLLPPEWEEALAQVMTHGVKKYAERNWELGMDWSKVYGPLRRHVLAWLKGEELDRESGLPHMAHVAWNALALMVYEQRRLGQDNLNRRSATLDYTCKDNPHV